MSDDIRKNGRPLEEEEEKGGEGPVSDEAGLTKGPEGEAAEEDLPDPDRVMPRDHDLYTPQGGGGGTGSGPIQEVAAVRKTPDAGPEEDLREDVARPGGLSLPQIADRVSESDVQEALGTPGVGEGVPGRPEVSSFRLLMTLGLAGALAGAVLVFVFLWSQPKILAYRAQVIRETVTEVLKGPDRFESLFVENGELVPADRLTPGVDTLDLDRVFLGYDDAGAPVGFALEAEGFGFQDIITLVFGYDPESGQVLGMKVLTHKETPGLGDKIVKDQAFVTEFDGVAAPIEGVKPDRNTGDPDQVDMITGATISSEAVIEIINQRIAQLEDLLQSYQPVETVTAGAPGGARGEGE